MWLSVMVTRARSLLGFGFVVVVAGCGESPKKFTTTMEIVQVEPFKDEKGEIAKVALEMKYAECPGDNRRVLHVDKAFAACGKNIKPGDKLKADMTSTWSSERGSYRSELTKLGDCAVKQDAKDDSNYEMVQTCTDVVSTGAVIGVRCDRTRSKELVAKCPWLRRK